MQTQKLKGRRGKEESEARAVNQQLQVEEEEAEEEVEKFGINTGYQ